MMFIMGQEVLFFLIPCNVNPCVVLSWAFDDNSYGLGFAHLIFIFIFHGL